MALRGFVAEEAGVKQAVITTVAKSLIYCIAPKDTVCVSAIDEQTVF